MLRFKQFQVLIEAKAKDVLEKYPHLSGLSHKHITKYGMALGKMGDLPSDTNKVTQTLDAYDRHGSKIGDFSQHKSFGDVQTALKPHVEKVEQASKKRAEETSGEKTVHDDGQGTVVKEILTPAAAQQPKYCDKTGWCVSRKGKSGEDHFNNYANQEGTGSGGRTSRMFVIHTPDGKMHAFHEGEGGNISRDKDDNAIHNDTLVQTYPQLAKVRALRNSNGWRHFITPEEKHDIQALHPNELIQKYGQDLHPLAQHKCSRDHPETHNKLMDIMGDNLHKIAQRVISKDLTSHLRPQLPISKNPATLQKLMDTMGNKLDYDVQVTIAHGGNSKLRNKLMDTMSDKLDLEARYYISEHPDSHQKLMDIMGSKLIPYEQYNIARNPESHQKLMDIMGDKLHPDAHSDIAKNPANHQKLMDTMGDKLHPKAQEELAKDPNNHDRLLKLFGDKLHPDAHYNIARNPESHQKLMDTMGDKLDPDVQYRISEHPGSHQKLMDIMGDKLHRTAQRNIARWPPSHQKLMDTMGDKLHPDAQKELRAAIDTYKK